MPHSAHRWLAIVLVAVACAPPGGSPSSAAQGSLTVYAAASLRAPFEALRAAWATARPGATLTFAFDASSTLRTQIEQGAPADVFASADLREPQTLVEAGLAGGQPTSFASNRLTIIVPTGDPAGIDSPADLARPGVRIVAAGPEVPITRYAGQVLTNLAASAGYPPDFVAAVEANVVSREDNVRSIVARIELGEGDAGIVYETDAAASPGTESVPIPDDANVPATYAAVSVRESSARDLADRFVRWLTEPEAQAVLAGFGFDPPVVIGSDPPVVIGSDPTP